jgi:hypothetical protein
MVVTAKTSNKLIRIREFHIDYVGHAQPLHLHLVLPPPRGRGSEILAVPGQMKEFRSLEGGEVRAPAELGEWR